MAYKIYGTDRFYNGRIVEIAGNVYSTRGGALEGDALLLIATDDGVTPKQSRNSNTPGGTGRTGGTNGGTIGGTIGGTNGGIVIDDPGLNDQQQNQGGGGGY